jgi:opacity protein-like surface antigen
MVLLLVAAAAADKAQAQVGPAPLELYGGYDYVLFRINANVAGQPPYQTFNANGGGGQLVYNVNNWLGVLGDVAGYWATNSRAQGAAIPYLFGPRINFRRHKMTPFAQVLVGGAVTSSGIQTFGWQNNFAMTAGGGLDVRLSEHITVRPVQAEYFLTKIPDGVNNRQNNFRYSAGISLLLGKSGSPRVGTPG